MVGGFCSEETSSLRSVGKKRLCCVFSVLFLLEINKFSSIRFQINNTFGFGANSLEDQQAQSKFPSMIDSIQIIKKKLPKMFNH